MPEDSDAFIEAIRATLSELAEDYARDRYDECLVNACGVFLRTRADRDSRLNKAALQFIIQCAAKLAAENERRQAASLKIACSFCGRSAPAVRLGAGPAVFICNECVAIFHDVFSGGSDAPSRPPVSPQASGG